MNTGKPDLIVVVLLSAHAVRQVCGEQVRVEVIERQSKDFEVLPKQWIVERTFGWLNRFRRQSIRL